MNKMSLESKIYPREKLKEIIAKLKKAGKKIGVTNGAFDLLHAGHVKYLEDAKKLCDILVVSVNTDDSVRLYKDVKRPINFQEDRAMVVAALASVDFVTFHSERRMRETLLALKPDFYIKGGDYNPKSLTSKDVLAAWSGEVRFIPLLPDRSTTGTIEKIASLYGNNPVEISFSKSTAKQKAVFLDRDGVINDDKEYVSEEKSFNFLPHVFEGLQKIQKMGYRLIILTNQAGIGLGYFTKEDFFRVNKYMLSQFSAHNVIISKVYFCPHSLADSCDCRKPKIGLFEKAKSDLNLDMSNCFMIGDKDIDMQAGKNSGCKTILISPENKKIPHRPELTARDLLGAAEIIQSHP